MTNKGTVETGHDLEARLANRHTVLGPVLAAYHALRCRDWARIDVRLDARGIPHILEVNPLPGVLPDPAMNSCFPKAARAAGMDYGAMIRGVLRAGAVRHGIAI